MFKEITTLAPSYFYRLQDDKKHQPVNPGINVSNKKGAKTNKVCCIIIHINSKCKAVRRRPKNKTLLLFRLILMRTCIDDIITKIQRNYLKGKWDEVSKCFLFCTNIMRKLGRIFK